MSKEKLVFYEKRALGRWTPRTTTVGAPSADPFTRNINEVKSEHHGLSLQELQEIYGTPAEVMFRSIRHTQI